MHTLGLGNLFDAFAKNDVSIDPAALDFRQGVEGVPKTDKPLLELQNFLGSSCRQAEYSIPSSQSRGYCALCRVSRRW